MPLHQHSEMAENTAVSLRGGSEVGRLVDNITSTGIHELDPLHDPRWVSFLDSHPRSSIFHTREWLDALRRTYKYTPRAFTTCAAGQPLSNALLFCQVDSWLSGSKLIALPFSDHCEPLVENQADLLKLLSAINDTREDKVKFVEIRPRTIEPEANATWAATGQYHFHAIDLRPPVEELYSRLHKDGVQRKIRRADRERVVLEEGRTDSLLEEFYRLLLLTRRRHRLPPQPLAWFRNLIDCLGPRLTIHVARVNDHAIGSILTLRHKRILVYKYGCSDERFHSLGAMPRLFWQAIQTAKSENLDEFDLGRSDETNPGLVRFKDHLGATRTSIRYWKTPREDQKKANALNVALKSPMIQSILLRLPDRLFRLAGELFYRHAG
jgi:hypothetical protein